MMSTSKPKVKPDIFCYADYRVFLKDVFLKLKSEKPKVSLESVARRSGLSKSYLRYVFEKQRHITLDRVQKIAKALLLEPFEAQALTYMVCRETCTESQTKDLFRNIIQNLKDPGFSRESLSEIFNRKPEKAIFKHWLSMVIHSLSKQKGFQPDPSWIRPRLKNQDISDAVIQDCLNGLLATKSIQKTREGSWGPAAFVYNTPEGDLLNGFRVYQVGLDAVRAATENTKSFQPATFHMMSLSFDDQNLAKFLEAIKTCRGSLIEASQSTQNPRYVMFFNLHGVCLAEAVENEEGSKPL